MEQLPSQQPEKRSSLADNVCLYLIVGPSVDEHRGPSWAGSIMVGEVPVYDVQRVVDMDAGPEWSQNPGDIFDSYPSPHIEKVVCVLILSPVPEGQRLEYGESAGAAYWDCPGRLLSG